MIYSITKITKLDILDISRNPLPHCINGIEPETSNTASSLQIINEDIKVRIELCFINIIVDQFLVFRMPDL